jgi:cytochrome c oxidase subunit 3
VQHTVSAPLPSASPDDHGHGAHDHKHQFEDFQQQREANVLGMWTFLVTEVLFFGGLFAAYGLYRAFYLHDFVAASQSLSIGWGTINTFVLLASSMTVVLAVRAAQMNNRKQLMLNLVLTIILGCAFLGVKVIEYKDKFDHHHVPGPNFRWEHGGHGAHTAPEEARDLAPEDEALLQARHAQLFFSLYFAMTGLHAVHMIIGIGCMSWLLWLSYRGRLTDKYYEPVEITGLYWHFVDIVWIFLFPLLYLIDRSAQHL